MAQEYAGEEEEQADAPLAGAGYTVGLPVCIGYTAAYGGPGQGRHDPNQQRWHHGVFVVHVVHMHG